MPERFAIYYAPEAIDTLWERAATWLGRDAADGDTFDGPVAGIDRSRLLNLTQSANHYGFHATIKAPMILAEGTDLDQLKAGLAEFAGRHEPVSIGRLKIELLGGFLALIPETQTEALTDFAGRVVEAFDDMRAPMTPKDREQRIAKGLTPRQIELLDGYGYPYVFEEFRFHMTLTDRLAEDDRPAIRSAAETWFGPLLDRDVMLDRLTLFHQSERERPFNRIADYPLGS